MSGMRIDLGELNLTATIIDLGKTEGDDQRVIIRGGEKLSGHLEQGAQGVELQGVRANRLLLDLLRLRFGTVLLAAPVSSMFQNLRVQLSTSGGVTRGHVDAERVNVKELTIEVGKLRITGELEAEAMTLVLDGAFGYVRAERAVFHTVTLEAEGLKTQCGVLDTEGFRVGWGDTTQIACAKAMFPSLSFAQGTMEASGTGAEVVGLEVVGSRIKLERATLAGLHGVLSFGAKPDSSVMLEHERRAKQVEQSDRMALWDKSMLDTVSGQLDVDVEVELAVPVIGSRRAVHQLRVPIQEGSIDFIALEKCLAPLEDALLNFAARENKLALEIGIPLIGPRGHGKPILFWDLNQDDQALAQQNRVRLAVLPDARGTSKNTETEEAPSKQDDSSEGSSKFGLRSLGFQNLQTHLSVAPHRAPLQAVLTDLVVGNLEASGDVFYDTVKAPRPGCLRGSARALACATRNMPLGSSTLSVNASLEQVADLVADFDGVRLQQVRAMMRGLEVTALSFEPGGGSLA